MGVDEAAWKQADNQVKAAAVRLICAKEGA